MREHPMRRHVVGEMHLRRWPPLHAPTIVIQWVRLVREDERATERAMLQAVPGGGSVRTSISGRHIAGDWSDTLHFTWERHSEASSLTLFITSPDIGIFLDPATDDRIAPLLAWVESLPGEVIRATRIYVAADTAEAQSVILPQIDILASDVVSCRIGEGVQLWSDFRIRPDGYGCLLLAANGTTQGDLSRLVQRLQELGNYRNLALLGLSVAQSCWPRLDAVEEKLQQLGQDVLQSGLADDILLERTSGLSLELMSIATVANYRMSATAAYAQLVDERLGDLTVEPIAGFPSLIDFTQRRFLPAVRTCASLTQRENQLSLRSAQFTALLRTRIETRIENQNARLLTSMEQSATRQLRLQQLVEGLSFVAVSYYCIGLIAYVFKGVEEVVHAFPAPLAIGLATPLVMLTVWLMLKHIKKRLLH